MSSPYDASVNRTKIDRTKLVMENNANDIRSLNERVTKLERNLQSVIDTLCREAKYYSDSLAVDLNAIKVGD